MMPESENTQTSPIVNEFGVVVIVIKIVILVIFLVPLAQYSMDLKDEKGIDNNATDLPNITAGNISNQLALNTHEEIKSRIVKKNLVVQPSCPISDIIENLKDVYKELKNKRELCTPGNVSNESKHKILIYTAKDKSLNKEAELPAIINYALGVILMVSLGAAVVELYKAKKQPSKKNGKNPLSRKCSLAELTVLKHQRKEMLRRDSLMELPEENLYALGFKPPPLQRRCSFPLGTTSSPFNSWGGMNGSRKPSMMRQTSVGDTRKLSLIFDSRRQSIMIDSRKSSIDYGGVSKEGSPERKHRARLVTRH